MALSALVARSSVESKCSRLGQDPFPPLSHSLARRVSASGAAPAEILASSAFILASARSRTAAILARVDQHSISFRVTLGI